MPIAYAHACMAPPKRKTGGGRVTPKGSRPEDLRATRSRSADEPIHHEVAASSRYTPKATQQGVVPSAWIPIIMLVLLIVGGLMIMARYLFWTGSNMPTLIGLACIMAGLWTATKWR